MRDRLLTPSKITAWLDCAHYLTLRHEVDSGVRTPPPPTFGEMAHMLFDKGLAHEREVLERYRSKGRVVTEAPGKGEHETFAGWAARVAPLLREGHGVLFQMPFAHDGIRGVADFLERVDLPDGGFTYEPVDAKLTRKEAKPGHVLQLCFYAEAIGAALGQTPEQLHIELGSGERETVRFAEVGAYWRRLRGRLVTLADEPEGQTFPEKCDHCQFCEFELVCDGEWRQRDSLIHVAGLRRADRHVLEANGVSTIADLAELDREVPDLDAVRVERLQRQASLQAQARQKPEGSKPPFIMVAAAPAVDDGTATSGPTLTGFAALPEPDDGDVFLDFEGHPFWRADVELFFLFGLIERTPEGTWNYRAFWAHSVAEEQQAVADLVGYVADRRARFPNMHVYHYNHTERSALERLTERHGVVELELQQQVATGMFVDLYRVVTGAMQVGVESYGLKHIEKLTDFERDHQIEQGAGAVVEYERYTADGNEERLDRIARYNEDDVRATMAVRDWLLDHRPGDAVWRPAVIDPLASNPDLDARIERLHGFGVGTPEHLMGDLLGYWRREQAVVAADCLRQSMAPDDDQMESLTTIARLELVRSEERYGKRGTRLTDDLFVLQFPPQPISPEIEPGSRLIYAMNEQAWAFFEVDEIDVHARELRVTGKREHSESGWHPPSLVHWVRFDEATKLAALCDLAEDMLAGRSDTAAHALLRRDPIAFSAGSGPADGRFVGDYESIRTWVPGLARSYLPVQGPPGTGKTFTGAHVVRTLVERGLRVGVTAMSHQAIDNFLEAVVERFRDDGVLGDLRAVHKHHSGSVTGIQYENDNGRCANGNFNVISGTPWLFANRAMRDNPVDVLIVDEAGQLGLADTLAAASSTTNVVLLGDPQQLPQVSQAVHPNGSGKSALEHLLGDVHRTFPDDRGVLLDVTWRMHPDVCGFISEVMYDGKLTSEASCHGQTTAAGTGLRWIRAEHHAIATESPEEAKIVASTIEQLIGTPWTNEKGETNPMTTADVIVVTPYNDQRRLIERTLGAKPLTADVEVGTVDKFQGREAAVVIFSMATSSPEFMPRQADFLFSKNRLNVAISRARCLAYLVCTDELLDTRARDVEQMTLISALCSFVERAGITTA